MKIAATALQTMHVEINLQNKSEIINSKINLAFSVFSYENDLLKMILCCITSFVVCQ